MPTLPASAAFRLALTAPNIAVPLNATSATVTVWNLGSQSITVRMVTRASWASPLPSMLSLPPGARQDVTITLKPGARGKVVVMAVVPDASSPGTIRVVRAVGLTLYHGIAPPRPVLPATGIYWPPWLALGLALLLTLPFLWRRFTIYRSK